MRKKKLHFFLGIFLVLILCTIFSESIQRQMTIQILVSKTSNLMNETELITYTKEILSDGKLYETEKGSQWDDRLRASVVPSEFYEIKEDELVLSPNISTDLILYRTRELSPGTIVEKTSVRAVDEEMYLILMEEKEPELRIAEGKEPFMENLQKVELKLSSEGKIYSILEVEQFFEQFPLLAVLMLFMAMILALWLYGWKVGGKGLLVVYLMIGGLLWGVHWMIGVIELPSSLLPMENIFEWSHYKVEFGEILRALEQIESETSIEILKNLWHNIWIGEIVFLVGIGIFVVMIINMVRLTKKYWE